MSVIKNLLKSTHTQHVDLFLCEEAPVATAKVFLGETGKLHTVELGHTIAKALENTAHDAVLATVNLYTHLTLVGVAGILDGIGLDLTIVEVDALCDLAHIMCGDVLVKIYMIHLLLQELRMSQLAGQVAIIGEQQHTCSISVESAYGIDTLRTGILHQIHHCLALLRVVTGGHIVLGLVEQHIDLLLQLDSLIMEFHLIGTQDFGSQFGHHLTIHSDYSSLDICVGLTTAAHTGIGEELVETNRLIGVDVLLFIFYALLGTVFCVRIIPRRVLTVTIVITTLLALVAALLALVAALLTLIAALLALIATLLTGLIATLLTLVATLLALVATLLTLIAALLTGLIAFTLLTGLIAFTLLTRLIAFTLLTGLIATLLTGLVATLLTGLIATLLTLIAALLALIATLLTGLVAALLVVIIVVVTWTELTLLSTCILQTGTKTLGAEAALVIMMTLCTISFLCVNARTLRTSPATIIP